MEVDQNLGVAIFHRLGDLLRDGDGFVEELRLDMRDQDPMRRELFGDDPPRPRSGARGRGRIDSLVRHRANVPRS